MWLSEQKMLPMPDLNHSSGALAVCLELSCWKVNFCPSLKFFADSNRFSSRISLNTLTSISPVHVEENHPQCIILSPPCVTVQWVALMAYGKPQMGVLMAFFKKECLFSWHSSIKARFKCTTSICHVDRFSHFD